MIWTSYFSNLRRIQNQPNEVTCISICNSKPEWLKGNIIDMGTLLGPGDELLRDYKYKGISEEEYTERYLIKLNNNKEEIINLFKSLNEGNVFLLCYEKPPKFCHRHILRKWLNDYFGNDFCKEYYYN